MPKKQKQPTSLITAREGPAGLGILLATVFLIIMLVLSVVVCIEQPLNFLAWTMLVLFAFPLIFILGIEQNIFPYLHKRKWISVALFYFCLVMLIPMGAMMWFYAYNVAIIVIFIIFFVPALVAALHMFTTQEQWQGGKTRVKDGVKRGARTVANKVRRKKPKTTKRKKVKRKMQRSR